MSEEWVPVKPGERVHLGPGAPMLERPEGITTTTRYGSVSVQSWSLETDAAFGEGVMIERMGAGLVNLGVGFGPSGEFTDLTREQARKVAEALLWFADGSRHG